MTEVEKMLIRKGLGVSACRAPHVFGMTAEGCLTFCGAEVPYNFEDAIGREDMLDILGAVEGAVRERLEALKEEAA